MDQDSKQQLEAEFAKEKEICASANASDYHKKRFAELGKKLGVESKNATTEESEDTDSDKKE
jgi:hypothetical protein